MYGLQKGVGVTGQLRVLRPHLPHFVLLSRCQSDIISPCFLHGVHRWTLSTARTLTPRGGLANQSTFWALHAYLWDQGTGELGLTGESRPKRRRCCSTGYISFVANFRVHNAGTVGMFSCAGGILFCTSAVMLVRKADGLRIASVYLRQKSFATMVLCASVCSLKNLRHFCNSKSKW